VSLACPILAPPTDPSSHYQLRHFISSPEQDLIYYASGADVYCLNAATHTQAHVTTLPWEARCTASGHGYLCIGGADDGNFAAIKVAGFPPADPSDVDASLPLDFESHLPRPPPLGTAHRIHLDKIGEDIVNSISVHKLSAQDGGPDEVVAVLTNNDKTVRIYSLFQNLELAVLDLPVAMNHATISPDGQMLVAVGDQQSGFFFENIHTKKPGSAKIVDGRIQSVPPTWQLFDEVSLYLPARQCAEGYFTTAWSSTGRLCAVGSECGYITVFDVDLLKLVEHGEDAIVQVISSTRPDVTTGAGAVRTMQFSPAPWDFLIWSEDQGRVCVADLRSGLKVRQVLTLDSKDKDVERVEIADFELRREADFIRRYRRALDSEGTVVAVNAANEYFEADSERQRLHRRLGVVESDDDPHGLTAHERQVLEALRSTRQHEEAREPGIRPRSINYTTVGHINTARYQARIPFSSLGLRADIFFRQRAAAGRDVPDLSDLLSEDLRQINRALQQRRAPRRQAAVIVSIDEGTINAPPPHVYGNITDSATTRSPGTVPAHALRATNDIITSTEDAWRTIEEALASQARAANSRAATSNPNTNNNTTTTTTATITNSTGAEMRSEVRRMRQMSQMRERLRNARASQPATETYEFSLGLRRSSRSTHDPAQGVRTAGLAMSQDGRTLYCGTEEGIFEFKMNLHARKEFPAITPR
jgi:WD40 repeat protein